MVHTPWHSLAILDLIPVASRCRCARSESLLHPHPLTLDSSVAHHCLLTGSPGATLGEHAKGPVRYLVVEVLLVLLAIRYVSTFHLCLVLTLL
ncbi:hypothetical protein C8R46DRAFT_552140 [Mycena filopes]|nr:hypothetical protein C8R46DRAFT_552140 [Mycena filopes]